MKKAMPVGRQGFTLIEILVAMAIFLTVILLITDIFLSVSNVQRVTLKGQKALNDLQTTMETVSYLVHNSKIDYDYYKDSDYYSLGDGAAVPVLALINSAGDRVTVGLNPNLLIKNIEITVGDDPADAEVLTPSDLAIKEFNLYISPTVDPFSFVESSVYGYESDQQFFVTVSLVAESLDLRAADREDIRIQTTISSRIYAR